MNLVKRENICVDLDLNSQIDILQFITNRLYEQEYITNKDDFLNAVQYRENQISTGIGNGIAIPHGVSNSVNESTTFIVKLSKGIDWPGSLDQKKVDLVILMAIEKNEEAKNGAHLKKLSLLAQKLGDSDFLNQIKSANTEKQIFDLIN